MEEKIISNKDNEKGSGLKVRRDKVGGDGFHLWSFNAEGIVSSIFLYDDEVHKLIKYFKEKLEELIRLKELKRSFVVKCFAEELIGKRGDE